ncbi:MAG: lipoyl synthase [Candidatus Omnitrophota bacterium]|nr:lipoyl synthase [Candidatus Omnitrophota bacterium]
MDKMKISDRPPWIRGRVSWDKGFGEVRDILRGLNLHSVCLEAACPNKGECWQGRHVTFLIMGDVCTRGCLFCNIKGGVPDPCDLAEPCNVAEAVRKLEAGHVVVTSVTRDDLEDRGAGHFVAVAREVKKRTDDVTVEFLIPDLGADEDLLRKVAFSGVEVIGHNIEMPEALYPEIRPGADYRRSLNTLEKLASLRNEGARIFVKSSVILGLGESEGDLLRTLEDLRKAGVDIVYLGQYLSPSRRHWPVKKYYSPDNFRRLGKKAEHMGFGAVCAGPMVRSSYRAGESYRKCKTRG